MFGLFKKKPKEIILEDFDGNPIKAGDRVESLRYELGECVLEKGENGIEYVSIKTGERVLWIKMIDASTERQKVRLIQ